MLEQAFGVRNILDIEQFDLGVALGVKVLVHVFQHVFDANLLAVTDRPHAVELQTLAHSRVDDEHGGSARAADKVGSFRVQGGDGQCEHAVVVGGQQADAVGANQGCAIFLAGVQDVLLQDGTLVGLLAKAGADDDECAHALVLCQVVHIVGAILRCHHQNGQIGVRQVLHVVMGLDALHDILLGVEDVKVALETALLQVAHDSATRLLLVVAAANDDNTLRIQ